MSLVEFQESDKPALQPEQGDEPTNGYRPIVPHSVQAYRIDRLEDILRKAGLKRDALTTNISLIIDYEPIREGSDIYAAPLLSLEEAPRLINFFNLIDTGLLEGLLEGGVKGIGLAELAYILVQYAQPDSIQEIFESKLVDHLSQLGLISEDIRTLVSHCAIDDAHKRIDDITQFSRKRDLKTVYAEVLEGGMAGQFKAVNLLVQTANSKAVAAIEQGIPQELNAAK